jgi:hypothetical protein
VRQALQILDNHNMALRTRGMRRKRQENYIVPGPDWLWCLDGRDKLARYGIEMYGSVDAYSRKIIWFYVGVSNRMQVSVLHQYLHTIETLGYCPNYLRTDRGRETPMMADAHYYLYHTACHHDDTISDEAFDNICFADCYLFGKSTSNVKIEGLCRQLIAGQTEQWMLYFPRKLEAEGWWRDDLVCDTVILVSIFIPIIRGEIFNWVADKNIAPIRPQRHRSQHVSDIPNDLYRGSDDAPRQGFSFDLNLHAHLEANVAQPFPALTDTMVRLLSCTVDLINPAFKVVMLAFQKVRIGIHINMFTIPDNTPSAIRTVTPRRQRRQPRITYLSQSLLAIAMTFFILSLWFGANQPIF